MLCIFPSSLFRPPSSAFRLRVCVKHGFLSFRPPSSAFRLPTSAIRPHPSVFIPASRFLLLASSSPLHASCFPLLASRFTLPAPRSSLPSFCRFSLPFLLPLLDAASRCRLTKQNHFALQYRQPNCRCRRERGVQIGFSSLITHHSSSPLHCFFTLVFSFNCLPLRPLRLRGEIWFSRFPLLASRFSLLSPQSSVARTTRRNTTPRLPSAGPEGRVQPGETPLQDCPAPGRRGAYNPAKHHSKIAQRRAGGARTTRRNTTPRLPSAGPEALSPVSSPFLLPAPCSPLPAPCSLLLASCFLLLSPQSSVARTTRRNTTPRLPSAGPEALSPAPRSPLLLSPVIGENLTQNCRLNQFVVPSAPAFALYLQELQEANETL